MNQADLIAHVANAAGLSKADASKAIDALLGAVSDELMAGKEVRLNGFGIFSATERAAREGRNPRPARQSRSPHPRWPSSPPRRR